MRKPLEGIQKNTPWCFYHDVDLVKVYYGDYPLRTYTEKDHQRHEEIGKTNATLANIGTIEAIIWSPYGDYNIYETGIGRMLVAKNNGQILLGELELLRRVNWNIFYSSMWDKDVLSILHIGTNTVQGWCNEKACGSPTTMNRTKEMDEDIIEQLLNYKDSDYGATVTRFLETARNLYEKDKTNHIMIKCMEYT